MSAAAIEGGLHCKKGSNNHLYYIRHLQKNHKNCQYDFCLCVYLAYAYGCSVDHRAFTYETVTKWTINAYLHACSHTRYVCAHTHTQRGDLHLFLIIKSPLSAI